jgi:hypothetical protein
MALFEMPQDQEPVAVEKTPSIELRLEEYKSLRAEVLERIREANQLVITSAGGIGGAYAILVSTFAREPVVSLSHASALVAACFLLVVWTPVVFAALASMKSRDIWNIVLAISDHICEIEQSIFGNSPEIVGWEHKRKKERGGQTRPWQQLSSPPYTWIYQTLIFVCGVIALAATGYLIHALSTCV